jgi:hypothetical protein
MNLEEAGDVGDDIEEDLGDHQVVLRRIPRLGGKLQLSLRDKYYQASVSSPLCTLLTAY